VLRLGDGSYFLTRYADLQAVYRDTKTFSSDKHVEYGPKYGTDSLTVTSITPPVSSSTIHRCTRACAAHHRRALAKAVTALEPGLIAMVDALLDALAAKDDVDLIEDFASTIPIEVIGTC